MTKKSKLKRQRSKEKTKERIRQKFKPGTAVRIHRGNGEVAGKGVIMGVNATEPSLLDCRVSAPGFESDPIDAEGTTLKFGPDTGAGQDPIISLHHDYLSVDPEAQGGDGASSSASASGVASADNGEGAVLKRATRVPRKPQTVRRSYIYSDDEDLDSDDDDEEESSDEEDEEEEKKSGGESASEGQGKGEEGTKQGDQMEVEGGGVAAAATGGEGKEGESKQAGGREPKDKGEEDKNKEQLRQWRLIRRERAREERRKRKRDNDQLRKDALVVEFTMPPFVPDVPGPPPRRKRQIVVDYSNPTTGAGGGTSG